MLICCFIRRPPFSRTIAVHHHPPLQDRVLILSLARPNALALAPALLDLVVRTLPFGHAPFVGADAFQLLLVVVLLPDEGAALLAFEVEGTALARPGGDGRVGLGEEALGLLVAVAKGWELPTLELFYMATMFFCVFGKCGQKLARKAAGKSGRHFNRKVQLS